MATTVNKTLRVYPKQQRFLQSRAMLRAFVGGIGSGKSYIGALDVIRRSKPGRLYLVTAPTYPMLSDATFRSFTGLARELGIIGAGDTKASPPPQVRLRTGAEVLFRSTDNPETLRGPNLSGVWMDEASLSKREALDILVGRLREGGEMGWLTSTFTPKGKRHWTYRLFGTGQPDTDLIHARSDENPFLPPDFVAKVRARYTAQQARQELGGEFLDEGGNHYHPHLWPRYRDVGDAYRFRAGERWQHVRKAECSRLVTLDWAMGKPKRGVAPQVVLAQGVGGDRGLGGDCTAFVVADFWDDGGKGMLFFLDCVCERIPLGQNAPRLAELCRRWRPVAVAGDDDNLSETMRLECARYRDIPSVRSVPIRGRNKLARSQASIIRGERGTMLLPDAAYGDPFTAALDAGRAVPIGPTQPDWVEMLSDYLASFTGADGEPDDVADCVSILGRLAGGFAPGEDGDPAVPFAAGGWYDGGGAFPSGAPVAGGDADWGDTGFSGGGVW